MFSTFSPTRNRSFASQLLNFAFILSTAFMIFKSLAVLSNCASPIVVVLSESMEPAMHRGDLIMLWNRGAEARVGEIVVYNVKGRDVPIVHRVVKRFGGGDEPVRFLTKGDNNQVDDTALYAAGQEYLEMGDVEGKIAGYVPWVGYVTILFNDYPWVKTVMLGGMGMMAILQQG